MSEITTQPQVGEILVDAQPQAEPQTQPQATEPQPQAPAESTETIPYLEVQVIEEIDGKRQKNDRKLTKEEAVQYTQKGFDYDRIRQRLKDTESELEALKKPLSPIAQRLGKDVKEVPEIFAKQWQAAEDAKLAKAQGKPVQDITAMREAQEAKEAAEAKTRELETAEQTRQRQIQETVEFNKTYPGIDIQKLPDEVIREWIDNGKPLVDVYRVHSYGEKEAEIQALKERIATMEQKETAAKINAENADTAPGKLGSGEPADKPLTLADLDNLTPDEKKRRHPEIWALLTGRKT